MDNTTMMILVGSAIGLALFCWALYEIIFTASYGRKTWVESRKQTALLKEMALKSGVHEGTIKELLDDDQYQHKSSM